MKTVEEVRRVRLDELLREYGSWARLNELVGRKKLDSTFSQIATRAAGSKSGAPKQMGSQTARHLELVLGKPTGWMDTDPDLLSSNTAVTLPSPATSLAELLVDAVAAMPNARWRAMRMHLDDLSSHPGMRDDVLDELRLLLQATPRPSTGMLDWARQQADEVTSKRSGNG